MKSGAVGEQQRLGLSQGDTVVDGATPLVGKPSHLPTRLHHHAYVTSDQEVTRRFYEDILGFPLTATWIEDEEFGGERIVFSHTFYSIADGGALAFFSFADPAVREKFGAKQQTITVHLALQVTPAARSEIGRRLKAAGIEFQEVRHGYCTSSYVTDPNGLILEFTEDCPGVEEINSRQRETAHATLSRWMAGSRESNKAEVLQQMSME
jgi:catechol 2,3-dioxygenase-like lactoylglutathione lyase family enzyme